MKKEIVFYELKPERKEHLMNVSNQVIDILYKECNGPAEAAIVAHFLKETLEEQVGKIGEIINVDDEKTQ